MLRQPKTHRYCFKNSADQKYQSIFFQEISQRKLLSYVYIVMFIPMYIFMFIPITGFLMQKILCLYFNIFKFLLGNKRDIAHFAYNTRYENTKKERKPLFFTASHLSFSKLKILSFSLYDGNTYPNKVITTGTTTTNRTVLMVTTLVENSTSPSP